MSWFNSRYVEELQNENARLRSQLAQERQEVKRLTNALVPALQRQQVNSAIPDAESSGLKLQHSITKAKDNQSASCRCGWKFTSDDPVTLQMEIREHYQETLIPIRPRKKTASEVIHGLESNQIDPLVKGA
jgi:hypothetical protein